MLLFRSEHARNWYERQGMSLGAMMTWEQQWELARTWYADRMARGWRSRTPKEAEAVFNGLGLTGDFRRLTHPSGLLEPGYWPWPGRVRRAASHAWDGDEAPAGYVDSALREPGESPLGC